MDDFQWYDYVRVLTILISLCSMYFLISRAQRMWHAYTRRIQQLFWVLMGFVMLLIEGSFETVISNTPGGPRTVLSLLVSLMCLSAARYDDTTKPNERRT